MVDLVRGEGGIEGDFDVRGERNVLHADDSVLTLRTKGWELKDQDVFVGENK